MNFHSKSYPSWLNSADCQHGEDLEWILNVKKVKSLTSILLKNGTMNFYSKSSPSWLSPGDCQHGEDLECILNVKKV